MPGGISTVGAFVTAVLFTVGKVGIGIYLGKTGVASAYGAASSLAVILLWVYYSALILFFGAEYTYVSAKMSDSQRDSGRAAPHRSTGSDRFTTIMKSHSPLPSQVADRRLWQIQPLRDLTGLIGIGLAIWLIVDLRRFFAPVFIAFALAYLVEPMIEALQKRTGLPRWVPALVCTLLLTAGLVLAVIWVGPLLAEQGKTLATHAPQYISTLEKRYGFNVGNLSDHLSTFAEGVKDRAHGHTLPTLHRHQPSRRDRGAHRSHDIGGPALDLISSHFLFSVCETVFDRNASQTEKRKWELIRSRAGPPMSWLR